MANCSSNKVLRNDGTSTCSGHKPTCSANNPISPAYNVGVGREVSITQLNDLRSKIQAALNRFRSHPHYNVASVPISGSTSRGLNIETSHLFVPANALDTVNPEVSSIGGTGQSPSTADNKPRIPDRNSFGAYFNSVLWSAPSDRDEGYEIRASHMLDIINSYNQLRQDCVCNTDCNCNSVCTCNNNCLCNY